MSNLEPPPTHSERQILAALIAKAPMKITGVDALPDSGGGAMTDPDTGEIFVRKGMEFADTFRSVAHELCYAEALRDESIIDPQFTAYCASYILCEKNGVDTSGYNFDSAAYMFSDMDAQTVKGELSRIRDTADGISARMAKQFEAQARAAKSQDSR